MCFSSFKADKCQHDHTLNAVTALAFLQAHSGRLLLLAGEGPFLKLFDVESSKLVGRHQVFGAQAIHGVVVNEHATKQQHLQVAIWGGPSLVLLSSASWEELLLSEDCHIADLEVEVSDWIIDGALNLGDSETCALVTAHNTVLQTRLRDGRPFFIRDIVSRSNSVLYSAHIVWEKPTEVLIAAGTVFGEIILWTADFAKALHDSQVLCTFTGHEGSIFGVNISPNLTLPHQRNARLMVSCSDDRTVRVWDIAKHPALKTRVEAETTGAVLQETGFGKNRRSAPEAKADESVAVVMGHASRIWNVRFQVFADFSVIILSFGEDSTTHQWLITQEQDSDRRYCLPHMQTFAFHDGKHIWSSATRRNSRDRTFLATGGSDGKIALYQVTDATSSSSTAPQSSSRGDVIADSDCSAMRAPIRGCWNFEDVSCSLPACTNANRDGFNRYAFISEDHLVITTTSGRVLLSIVGHQLDWRELELPNPHKSDLKSYSVVKASRDTNTAFLAGSNGNIFVYHAGSEVRLLASIGEKVADMFTTWALGALWLFITSVRAQSVEVFELNIDVFDNITIARQSTWQFSEKIIVTSVGFVKDIAIFGSREGVLATCEPRSGGESLDVCDLGVISGDAVTSIIPIPNASDDACVGIIYFLATCRDGTYSIFSCRTAIRKGQDRGCKISLERMHQSRPPFGPMIEAAWFHGKDLILQGFKSKNFIVWNETQQTEVMTVECGGAHRSYVYTPYKDTTGGTLVFARASKLHVHSQQDTSHRTIKRGGHGREIKACAVSSDQRLFATGAEDTNIRVWAYVDHNSALKRDFNCLTTIQKHTAGIQQLQWYKAEYLFSSAGNEEFYVWAVHGIPGFGIGVVCEASCPDQTKDQDLRIMNFDASELSANVEYAEELRLVISLAYSDSILRTYTYSRSQGFRLAAKARYASACLTQIKHLSLLCGRMHLLTGATDGNLSLWECKLSYASDSAMSAPSHKLTSTTTTHQNTIKSISSADILSSEYHIIALGGDDNALGIAIYSTVNLLAQPRIFMLRSAHAAAITGLCFLPSGEGITRGGSGTWKGKLVSSGNDQRVKEWALEIVVDKVAKNTLQAVQVEVRKLNDVSTTVADVAAVEVLQSREGTKSKVLVVGNGMDAFTIYK